MAASIGQSVARGQEASPESDVKRRKFTSRQIVLHTDVDPPRAKRLLHQAELTIRKISKYWRCPLRGRIECYVVEELEHWPEESFPDASARDVSIAESPSS